MYQTYIYLEYIPITHMHTPLNDDGQMYISNIYYISITHIPTL